MRNQLNISIAWFLLIMLFYNMGGYLVVFNLSEMINRNCIHQILSGNDNDELLLLKIADKTSFTRIGDDEIIYEGKRYDVKKEFTKGGINYFYCINDKDEENIYASLNTSVNNNSDSKNESKNTSANIFLKLLVKDYFLNEPYNKLPDSFLNIFNQVNNFIPVSNVFVNVITPPPEFFYC